MNIPVWFLLDTLLLLAISLNVIGSYKAFREAKRMERSAKRLNALAESPFYECATRGHDLAMEVKVLEHQEPPIFTMTHLIKWTCRREGCEYMHVTTLRETLNAPGVQRIEARWLEQEEPPHPAAE